MLNGTEHQALRQNDIVPPHEIINKKVTITINGNTHVAYQGESVLATLLSMNIHSVSRNDHGVVQGAYCGMGICYCCMVKIDDRNKQRACQRTIEQGMNIDTLSNHFTTLLPVLEKKWRLWKRYKTPHHPAQLSLAAVPLA